MSSEQTVVDFLLQVNTEQADREIAKLETNLMRILSLTKRLTGDEDLRRGISLFERTISTINALQVAYAALKVAQLGMGPIGWVSLGLSLVATAFTVSDTVMSVSRGY